MRIRYALEFAVCSWPRGMSTNRLSTWKPIPESRWFTPAQTPGKDFHLEEQKYLEVHTALQCTGAEKLAISESVGKEIAIALNAMGFSSFRKQVRALKNLAGSICERPDLVLMAKDSITERLITIGRIANCFILAE
ncbi:unnamed protein product [Dicrocoelium dendriticum]|nr:unnamed protein product [Dicrocoelium dendriticum]